MSDAEAGTLPVVLQALKPPGTDTTYAVHLENALDGLAQITYFTWREALAGRYDILHVHWPEYLLRGRGRRDLVINAARLPLLIVLLGLRRIPIVRTLHNPKPHETGSRIERVLMHWLFRRTSLFIRLNPITPLPDFAPGATIPHGHYRDQFAAHARAQRIDERILYFGLVRPYKGIEVLLTAFGGIERPTATLRVVGRPNRSHLADTIQQAAAGDSRVTARLEFVPDDALVSEVSQAQLVALAYQDMHNSGAILVALSLCRPVLAMRNAVTEALADEVGENWLYLYDGPLTTEILESALDWSRDATRSEAPVFIDRDWDEVGRAHAAAYATALGLRRAL